MHRSLSSLALLALLAGSLAQAHTFGSRDSDGDGIADAIEDRVLGTGDGNRDGIADARQGQVVSFEFPDTNKGGGGKQGTVSNTELSPQRAAGTLLRVQPIDWSAFGGTQLGSRPPVQIEAAGDALVLRYELHAAGLAEGSRFYWLSATTGAHESQSYFIDVLGAAEQAGDSFALLIEDGGPQDLDKEPGQIRAIGFPR